jgi:hypothetical protein
MAIIYECWYYSRVCTWRHDIQHDGTRTECDVQHNNTQHCYAECLFCVIYADCHILALYVRVIMVNVVIVSVVAPCP